jgi:hypothetical protein
LLPQIGGIWSGGGGERIFLINYVWFNFKKERGGERRGAKHLKKPIFASPNWGDLEGSGGVQ